MPCPSDSQQVSLQLSTALPATGDDDNVQPVEEAFDDALPCSPKMPNKFQKLFARFPKSQFIFSAACESFDVPGGLDLYSGNRGVAKQTIRHGAPWVLCFDWKYGNDQDLLCKDLQDELLQLLEDGLFASIGMAPICASFSRAITPCVRSRRWPRGIPSLQGLMLVKVIAGNKHASFCAAIVRLAIKQDLAYWLENPDKSYIWMQKVSKSSCAHRPPMCSGSPSAGSARDGVKIRAWAQTRF